MPVLPACTRHDRHVWMACCPDCTAWHLAVEIARRDGAAPSPETAAPATLHRPGSAPAAARAGGLFDLAA
jgi:hypothetical protein